VAHPTHVLGQAQAAASTGEDSLTKQLVTQLEIEQKQAAIDESKSRRLWAAVAGFATLTTAFVGLLTYLHARNK
jgi:hypothetical protein